MKSGIQIAVVILLLWASILFFTRDTTKSKPLPQATDGAPVPSVTPPAPVPPASADVVNVPKPCAAGCEYPLGIVMPQTTWVTINKKSGAQMLKFSCPAGYEGRFLDITLMWVEHEDGTRTVEKAPEGYAYLPMAVHVCVEPGFIRRTLERENVPPAVAK